MARASTNFCELLNKSGIFIPPVSGDLSYSLIDAEKGCRSAYISNALDSPLLLSAGLSGIATVPPCAFQAVSKIKSSKWTKARALAAGTLFHPTHSMPIWMMVLQKKTADTIAYWYTTIRQFDRQFAIFHLQPCHCDEINFETRISVVICIRKYNDQAMINDW